MAEEYDEFANLDDSDIDSAPKYIGVPNDYKTKQTEHKVTSTKAGYGFTEIRSKPVETKRAPRYLEGAQFRPASRGPEYIASVQDKLLAAGLLTGGFSYGTWDAKTANAYKQVLALANRAGIDENEAFAQYLRSPVFDASASRRTPFRAELPNPDDLRKRIDEAATEEIGRGLSPEERETLVKVYSSLVATTQRRAYDTAETGGSVTDAPSFDTFVENELERRHPDEYGAKQMADLSKAFLASIQSSMASTDRVF